MLFQTNLRSGNDLHFLNNLSFLVSREDIGDIPSIKNHVNIFNERFVLYLIVTEQENHLLTLGACFNHHLREGRKKGREGQEIGCESRGKKDYEKRDKGRRD